MKNLLLALTLVAYTLTWSQTDQETLTKTFNDYFKTVEAKDNAASLEYIYPRLFDHYPKESMLKAMNQMHKDTTSIISMENNQLQKISKVMEVEGSKYALVKYAFTLTMQFKVNGSDFNPAEMTFEMLKNAHKEKNLSFDNTTNTIKINVENAMYAINDPKLNGWKFLEKKENMLPILRNLLPEKVIKKL